MTVLIERRAFFHVGYNRAAPSYAGTAISQLNLGWVSICWFNTSLHGLLAEWKAEANRGVRREFEQWKAAETIAKEG